MVTATALIVKANGTTEEVTYDVKNQYDTLVKGIGGGYIATVPGLPNIDAYCDDEGLVKGMLVNRTITNAIRKTYGGPIVGDVIFPKMTDTKRTKLAKLGIL